VFTEDRKDEDGNNNRNAVGETAQRRVEEQKKNKENKKFDFLVRKKRKENTNSLWTLFLILFIFFGVRRTDGRPSSNDECPKCCHCGFGECWNPLSPSWEWYLHEPPACRKGLFLSVYSLILILLLWIQSIMS
jgi:hypothetical protein